MQSNGETPHSTLPVADSDDLLHVLFNPDGDINHTERWQLFCKEQPDLSKELREAVTFEVTDIELRKKIFDYLSFSYAALRSAVTKAPSVDSLDPAV